MGGTLRETGNLVCNTIKGLRFLSMPARDR